MDEQTLELGEYTAQKLSQSLVSWHADFGELTVTVARDQILTCLKVLKEDVRCQFSVLVDICGVDMRRQLSQCFRRSVAIGY